MSLIWTTTPGDFQAALTNVKWDPDRVTNIDISGFYPTLEIRDNLRSGHVKGTWATSNLPDPKYNYESDGSEIDEVEVVSRSPQDLQAYNPYKFETYWTKLNQSTNQYMIAYSSLSSSPSCSWCDYNTVYQSDYPLAGIYTSEMQGNPASMITHVSQSEVSLVPKSIDGTSVGQKKRNLDYEKLRTKEELEDYKQKSEQKLEIFDDKSEKKFMITFNSPLEFKQVKEKISLYESQLDIEGIYTRSIGVNGDIFTGIAFSFDNKVLDEIKNQKETSYKGIIQIEGKAPTEVLKKLTTDKDVFAVEVADNEYLPVGLYWKLEHSEK